MRSKVFASNLFLLSSYEDVWNVVVHQNAHQKWKYSNGMGKFSCCYRKVCGQCLWELTTGQIGMKYERLLITRDWRKYTGVVAAAAAEAAATWVTVLQVWVVTIKNPIQVTQKMSLQRQAHTVESEYLVLPLFCGGSAIHLIVCNCN